MEAGLTIPASISRAEKLCDAPCYNTNKFAPGAYQVRCDQCEGRRGHLNNDYQWVECTKCLGTGSVCCPKCRGTGKLIEDL
jgi:DnaJ-class molecular chaperone